MRSTFKLLFYINRQKVKKNGRCPVMGRVTLDGKVSQYSTGLEIESDLWDAKKGKAFADGRKTGNITGEKRKRCIKKPGRLQPGFLCAQPVIYSIPRRAIE